MTAPHLSPDELKALVRTVPDFPHPGIQFRVKAVMRRAAGMVDQILRGAKPGDIPFEQVTKLELVVNLKGARAIGVTIPYSVLVGADEVIQ